LEQQADVESPVKVGSPNPDEARPRLTKEQRKGNYRLWQFGRVLGVAAISNSGGKKPEVVEVLMKEANRLAKEIGVELLEFPERQNDEVKDGLAAMSYLIKTVGVPVRKYATRQYGPDSARLYDLAVYSSLLSLLYGPEVDAAPIRKLVEESAREARVPEGLWKPLLKKVDDKARAAEVQPASSKKNRTANRVTNRPVGDRSTCGMRILQPGWKIPNESPPLVSRPRSGVRPPRYGGQTRTTPPRLPE
jgi:hypothetical protein